MWKEKDSNTTPIFLKWVAERNGQIKKWAVSATLGWGGRTGVF